MQHRTCLNCGMSLPASDSICPKCDENLDEQTDGSTFSVDIAHQGERLREALAKLARALDEARLTPARDLRVVVGTGAIREAVLAELAFLERRGDISSHAPEPGNAGSVLVRIKDSRRS